jgi:hypothetical protein
MSCILSSVEAREIKDGGLDSMGGQDTGNKKGVK